MKKRDCDLYGVVCQKYSIKTLNIRSTVDNIFVTKRVLGKEIHVRKENKTSNSPGVNIQDSEKAEREANTSKKE